MEAALNSSLGRTVLGTSAIRIGRSSENGLTIQDSQASSRHAEIAPDFSGNGYQITDLGSTNGTFINEQRLPPNSPRTLNAGDVIRIGQTRITFEVSGASYAPTVLASQPSYAPTTPASDPFASPAFQEPQAYGNYNAPAQPPYTPPPAYPQPVYQQYPQGQPGYPQPAYLPPAYQQPGMLPQKKSKTGLFLTLGVILALLVVGGGVFAYIQLQASPQKTVQAYCNALKAGDYQTAYNQYSSNVQSRVTETQYATVLRLGLSLQGGLKDCTINSVTQDSSTTAHASVTSTFGNGHTSTGTVNLVLENGNWKINVGVSNTNITN